ncbi:MAG: AAA family ATPase [Dehalococcoidia bacterium]
MPSSSVWLDARHSRPPFVGRDEEMAALRTRLADARLGAGGVIVIAGEPGIGKTRLVAELAAWAQNDGWQLLSGRAHQADGLPPYLPFIEALRNYVRDTDPTRLEHQLGTGAAPVAMIVPDLRTTLPHLPDQPLPSVDTERYVLFEGIADFLIAIARSDRAGARRTHGSAEPDMAPVREPADENAPQGLLFILDDLHWADVSSVQLLLHLSRRLTSQPVLLLGTYRDIEVGRGHPIGDVLTELVRTPSGDQVTLHGLRPADVARFIELTADVKPSPALVETVYQETEGNPLFVVELVRLLVAEGRLDTSSDRAWRLTIPRSVQQVIGRRLDRLSADCDQVLTLAAVIGREFSLLVLQQAGDVRGEGLLAALDEAEAAHVITPVPGVPGRSSFSHPLIRETLYAQILSSRRLRLHRRIGETLERMSPASEAPLAELAYHFFQSAPAGDAGKAIDYARRAGDASMAVFAYEEAARLYLSALQALTLQDPDEGARCGLLLALAESQTRSGETAAAKETFVQVAALAHTLGLAALQARAALGYGGYRGQPGRVDTVFVGLAEEALTALGDEVSGLRARLLARLAMELASGFDFERCDALSEEAVDVARRSGDLAARAATLVGRHYATHNPDNLPERLAIGAELIALAEEAGDHEVALQGYYLRVIDALEAADIATVDAAVDAHARLAAEVRQPLYQWRTDLDRSMQAACEGRFADGAALAQRAFAIAGRAQLANGLPALGTQMLAMGIHTGAGLETLEPGWRSFVDRFPAMTVYRCGLMLLYLYLDRLDEARDHFEIVAAAGLERVPRDSSFFAAIASLIEVCVALDDTARAAVLYDILVPYEARAVATDAALACLGAVAEYLGMLATTLGRWDTAERHFRDALAINTRLRARPHVLRTRLHHAAMLLRRGAPDDIVRAGRLLRDGAPAARELGLTFIVQKTASLLEQIERPGIARRPPLPDGLTDREVEVLRLLAAGQTNREIAGTLVLSARTVDHHIANIYRKINARRRADAAAYAQRVGLAPATLPDA